jgi:Flp pilus assembly protein TadD
VAYALFADPRFRDQQPQSVIDVLQPAWERTPDDDGIARRLANAYVMTGKIAESLPVFEGYLRRHPEDQDSVVAAIAAQYEATTRAGLTLTSAERARINGWSRAYTGPQRALIERYLEVLK